MPQALPLTSRISQGSTRTRTNRVRSAQFGDGYSQEAPDGINSLVDTWSLTFEHLDASERALMWAFLDNVGSWDIVTWTPIGSLTQQKFKVTPDGATESPQSGDHYAISFSLKQVF